MSDSTHRHRSPIAFLGPIAISIALVGLVPSAVDAADESANPLDHARADVAVLSPGPDGRHRLLVIDPIRPGGRVVRAEVLERDADRVWSVVTSLDVAVPPVDVADAGSDLPAGQPWMVALDGGRFALILASETRGETTLLPLVARSGASGAALSAGEPVTLDTIVDDAGSADVDANGTTELVVASARTLRQGGTCQSSRLWVLDSGLRVLRSFEVPERRLASGVLGAFDDAPGDDLVAYAHPNCPASPDVFAEQRLVAIRLSDGSIWADRRASAADSGPTWSAPPMRLDADGDGRHELSARLGGGLLVVDPHGEWADIRVASDAAFPLGATVVTDIDGGTAARVAWLEPSIDGRALVGTALVRRNADGALDPGPATVMRQPITAGGARWTAAVVDAIGAAARQSGPVGYLDSLSDPDCADLVVPLVVVPCAASDLLPGPAWLSTRPIAAIGPPDGRLVITTVGIARQGVVGLPASPTQWAGGAPGRWRHGPSAPFALSEVPVDDVLDGRRFVPPPTIDRDAAVGPVASIGGTAGLRLLVTVGAVASDAPDPEPDPFILDVLEREPPATGTTSIVRLPVRPGAVSGVGRGSAIIDLHRATLGDGAPAERWTITALAFDDRGEMSEAFVRNVRLDLAPPDLTLSVPAVTPFWPVAARIDGSVELGARVRDDDGSEVEVAPDGSFVIERTLAPWPQAIRLVATDAFGNESVEEVTVVGGIDYRAWAWPAILAGLVIVAAVVSGTVGTRWRRSGSAAGSAGRPAPGDWPVPELEELGPGEGSVADR